MRRSHRLLSAALAASITAPLLATASDAAANAAADAASPAFAHVLHEFPGLRDCQQGACWPSPGEPSIAVGPTDVVETVNSEAAVFSKATGRLLVAFPFSTFWTGGPNGSCVEARVIFLPSDDRFAMSCADFTLGMTRFAVSASADPTKGWHKYVAGPAGEQPMIVATADKLVVAAAGNPDEDFYVYSKHAVLAGAANPPAVTLHAAHSNAYTGVVEETMTGDAYFVSTDGNTPSGTAEEWLATISGAPGSKVALSEANLGAATYSAPHEPAVPGGTIGGGDLEGRAYDAVYEGVGRARTPTIQYASASTCGPRDCVVSGRLSLTGGTPRRVYEQSIGTAGADDTYGAVALDGAGRPIEAYSRSSAHRAPGAAVLGPGFDLLLHGAVAGSSSCTDVQTPPCDERWGDYLGAAIDPVDPTAVWVTGLYQTTSGPQRSGGTAWQSVIAEVTATDHRPTVTAVSPASGPGTGGTRVTIRGTFLSTCKMVIFGSEDAVCRGAGASAVTAVTPPHERGAVEVRVVSRFGESLSDRAARFTYLGSTSR